MDINQIIIELSSQIGSIQQFCSFVSTFCNLTNCTRPRCDIRSFNDKLKQVVVESTNNYVDARHFFVRTCVQNTELFKSVYSVYKKENIQEIASLLPLICMENYPTETCICKICLFIFWN